MTEDYERRLTELVLRVERLTTEVEQRGEIGEGEIEVLLEVNKQIQRANRGLEMVKESPIDLDAAIEYFLPFDLDAKLDELDRRLEDVEAALQEHPDHDPT